MRGLRQFSQIGLLFVLGGCITSGETASNSAPAGEATFTTASAESSQKQLARCTKPLGTVIVAEPDAAAVGLLQSQGLQSPTPFLRIMMSQSNCFRVIDPSFARTKRARVARWVVTPNIILSNPDAGGINVGSLLSVVPGVGYLSSMAGSVHTKQVQTALFLSEAKTGIQVAAVQGHAESTDFNASFAGQGSFGGYTSTPEGKVVMASYADAFNNLVDELRTHKAVSHQDGTRQASLR